MRMYDIIQRKKAHQELTEEEIRFLIAGYTAGDIPDYQMAAFAMAVYFNGMTPAETAVLTDAMMHSGDTVDLSRFGTLSVDKHSTGGVGDKTSLIVAPIVSALGGKLAKMSGRGLGHTGGTVDKLESIPGFRTELSADAFMAQVEEVGVAVIGQSGDLAPADKKLYALRDVTATVDSVPLIASSIMSKKLAAGSHSIVLDVKVGSGAFMKTRADGEALARQMVDIAAACGRQAAALVTNMDVPLGSAVGNAIEVMEAVEILLCLCQGWSPAEAAARVTEAVDSGAAFEQFCRWVTAQGGDAAYLRDVSLFPSAPAYEVCAPADGYIADMDAERIGIVGVALGAGRATKEEAIDFAAGIRLLKKTGDAVKAGEPVAVLYTNRADAVASAKAAYLDALTFAPTAPAPQELIYTVVR